MRAGILYALAYLPLLTISFFLSYANYKRRVKRYRKVFFKTLVSAGVPRDTAKSLTRMIKTLSLRDFIRHTNMRNVL
ncbi:MAG: hypothetical protein GXO25_00950 [Euryarchaeota archaeon]|nr:hypothetical protein [Euryarchaeota archaeon]